MPHYKDHKLAGEDHKDVFLAEQAEQGDALVWKDINIPDLSAGVHVPGIDPNLTELELAVPSHGGPTEATPTTNASDEQMMPIEFYGIWIPGPSSGTGGEGTGSRAFSYFMGS